MENLKGKKLRLAGTIILVLLLGWIIKRNFINQPALITVVGEGKVEAKPDMVKFNLAVQNTAPNATLAIADNNRIIRDLISVMKNNGIKEDDIQIAYVRVIPPQTTLGQTSYQAINSADVTLRNITMFDNLVMQLYANGATSITNIIFTTENSRDLEKQAVAQAIKEAKQRAKELAKASGKRLGRMVSIATEEVGEAGAIAGQTGKKENFGSAVTASPSQIEIIRQASIVFELK